MAIISAKSASSISYENSAASEIAMPFCVCEALNMGLNAHVGIIFDVLPTCFTCSWNNWLECLILKNDGLLATSGN
jgi:hypothetical protein